MSKIDKQTQTEIEAAAFRGFIKHLQERKDAQNIDLMNLAGFCRNCLYKWMVAEAEARDADFSVEDAQEYVYGMPLAEWKANHQGKASDEQMAKFNETKPIHAKISGHN